MSSHTRALRRWIKILSIAFVALATSVGYLIWRDTLSRNDELPTTEEASSVRIQRKDFDDIVLRKTDDRWHVQSPCLLPANQQRLSPLLGALTSSAHQYHASDVDLQTAGLTTPSAIVYINEIEHRIGNSDLNGERRYVQRGNTVQFTPEWILSLINGGITAIAQLDVFTEPLSSLWITDSTGKTTQLNTAQALEQWQALSAQQIVTWPPPELPSAPTFNLLAENTSGNSSNLNVYKNQSFIAIRVDGADCAYILEPDALPN